MFSEVLASKNKEKNFGGIRELAKKKKKREECLGLIFEKINIFYDFKNGIEREKLNSEINKNLDSIEKNINKLELTIKNSSDDYDMHSQSHFYESLGHLIGSACGMVNFILKGKEKYTSACVSLLKQYDNYFQECVDNEEFFKEELATQNGVTQD